MDLRNNTVLITGGATGIGLELAKAFLERGNSVLICGRREEKLEAARHEFPSLTYRVADILNRSDRGAIFEWSASEGVNILVNNAGMQREVDFTKGLEALESGDNEIGINLEAAVYLTAAFTPYLMTKASAAIANVSSGLGFIPIASLPIYCATKAALHSLTISLRHQLRNSRVKVFEIIPPTVDTELDRGARARRGQIDRGISAKEVAEETMRGMAEDLNEIAIGRAASLVNGSQANFDEIFRRMNGIPA
ncbi:MAG TPA: SDR family NAD(P)-dependent oxidoreductase [Candidatus Kapabacteria bacterium]|jgi:uncharacterized oxidoreductase